MYIAQYIKNGHDENTYRRKKKGRNKMVYCGGFLTGRLAVSTLFFGVRCMR